MVSAPPFLSVPYRAFSTTSMPGQTGTEGILTEKGVTPYQNMVQALSLMTDRESAANPLGALLTQR